MASVRIEGEAFSDERYDDLAAAAGLADGDHARGKMARIWRQCTIEQCYVLPVETITRILGERGCDALIKARLGDMVKGGMRIRGTKGRIEWLKKLRDNGKFGHKGGRPKKNPEGFPKEPSRVSKTDKTETPLTPALAPSPALTQKNSDPEGAQARTDQPSEKPKPEPKRPRRLPEDWKPTPKHLELAAKVGVDCSVEAEKFRDHWNGKGKPMLDWDACFRTWLRNAPGFARGSGRAPAQPKLFALPKSDTDMPPIAPWLLEKAP